MKHIQLCVSPYYWTLSILFFYGFSNILLAQNLVPNGSFEEGIICPTSVANLTNECVAWYGSLLYSNGAETTPDWFHECSDESLLTPPEVAFGSQYPYEGGGFSGLVAFSLINENRRELIGVKLIEPLIAGNVYLIEFFTSNFYFPDYVVASNRFGFNFSTQPYYYIDNFPFNTSHYSTPDIIPATGEWHSISEYFLADSAYQYFHIGNFYDDNQTSYIANSPFPDISYYGVDNVSITGVLSNSTFGNIRSRIKVFPNPTFQNLNIELPENQIFSEIRVFDSIGNQVIWICDFVYSGQRTFSVSNLAKGLYHLQIITNKSTSYETFVKI